MRPGKEVNGSLDSEVLVKLSNERSSRHLLSFYISKSLATTEY
jgi:hypothetical protein